MSKWKCDYCEQEIRQGDEYLKYDDGRYCKSCYNTDTVTYYYIGGEYIGTDNDDVAEFYSWEIEDIGGVDE